MEKWKAIGEEDGPEIEGTRDDYWDFILRIMKFSGEEKPVRKKENLIKYEEQYKRKISATKDGITQDFIRVGV